MGSWRSSLKGLLAPFRWPGSLLRWLRATFDRGDVTFFSGLGLLGYGIHLVEPAWAYIVVGSILVLSASSAEIAGFLRVVRVVRHAEKGQ